MQTKWRMALIITQGLYVLLLLNLSVDYWFVHPLVTQSPFFIWGLKCLPLLLFVPGIIKGYPRWLAWLCFVTLFYFISAVVSAWLPPHSWTSFIEIVICVLLFCSSMFAVRWYYT